MIAENIRVRAYEFESRCFIGEYDNCGKAARALFIKHNQRIYEYILGSKNYTFKGTKRGVLSKKTGIRYHFEQVK